MTIKDKWDKQQALRNKIEELLKKQNWTWTTFCRMYRTFSRIPPVYKLKNMSGFLGKASMKSIEEFVDNCHSGKIHQIHVEKMSQSMAKCMTYMAGINDEMKGPVLEQHDLDKE